MNSGLWGLSSPEPPDVAVVKLPNTFAQSQTFNNPSVDAWATQGSILFVGSGGKESQDNAHIFWDSANHRLGLWTATPAFAIDAGATANVGASYQFQSFQNQANSTDVGDGCISFTYFLTATTATNELVVRFFQGTASISLTGGGHVGTMYMNAFTLATVAGVVIDKAIMVLIDAGNNVVSGTITNFIGTQYLPPPGVTSAVLFLEGTAPASGTYTVYSADATWNAYIGGQVQWAGGTNANGQLVTFQSLTELTTIAAAATTDTVISIPANAVVFGVSVRTVTTIPTATTYTVTGATSATVFNTAAVSTAGGSTDPGTKSCPFFNATAQHVRITPNLTPGAATGQVRVTIHYYTVTPPTS